MSFHVPVMIIFNSLIENNNYPAFQRNVLWAKRPEKICQKNLSDIISLAEKFEKVHNFTSKCNSAYYVKFKELCSNLIMGKKIRGFVFSDILPKKNEKIQVAKLSKSNDNEILTISWINKYNQNIKRYRLGHDGYMYSPPNELEKQPKFNFNILPALHRELDKLLDIADNYELAKKMRGNEEKVLFTKLAKDLRNGTSNLKTKIDALFISFNSVHSKLAKNPQKAIPLKEEFLGTALKNSRSFAFKNRPNDETYAYIPTRTFGDGRNSVIQIKNQDGKPVSTYILFDDGSIQKVINNNKGIAFLRPCDMLPVVKSSNEEKEAEHIIDILISKLDEFSSFIDAKNESCSHKRGRKKREFIQIIQSEEPLAPVKTKVSIPAKIISQEQKIHSVKPKNIQQEVFAQENTSALKEAFKKMDMAETAQRLTKVFHTPAQNRSTHLIHEKMADGRILGGHFFMTTPEGTKITVARKKAENTMNYTYFAITVEKNNTKYQVSLDETTGEFIDTKPDGKICLNHKNAVIYRAKRSLLCKFPDIVHLPEYIEEICRIDNTHNRQYINSHKPVKTQASLLEQKEMEIQRLLRKFDRGDESFL